MWKQIQKLFATASYKFLTKSDNINIENIQKSHFSERTSIENDSLQIVHSSSDNCIPQKQNFRNLALRMLYVKVRPIIQLENKKPLLCVINQS